jgi:AraC-like DNA-binding protein
MHVRSYLKLPQRRADVQFDAEFPCLIHLHHRHSDRPITFLHAHDCLEIGYCHEGTGIFVIDGHVHPFSTGDIAIIAPAQMHLAQSTGGATSLWTWMYLDPARLLILPAKEQHLLDSDAFARLAHTPVLTSGADPTLTELIRQAIDEAQCNDGHSRSVLRGLFCAILARLHRRLPTRKVKKPSARRTSAFGRIEPILAYLAGHYADDIAIDALAARAHVSIATLRRLFHQALGLAPLEYLIGLRIQMACSLLIGTDRPIVQIAADVGFATLSSFNRHFKAHTNLSPRQYRSHDR